MPSAVDIILLSEIAVNFCSKNITYIPKKLFDYVIQKNSQFYAGLTATWFRLLLFKYIFCESLLGLRDYGTV